MAAGLGFKDFTTGEVLTAADVDGYLMQGIWVFANATARDAAVTSPQEGNACYLKDTNQVLTYSGSAWVAVGGGSPLTTKGDLYGFSTVDARIPIGANDTVLTADSTQALGLKWAAPAGGSFAGCRLTFTGNQSISNATSTKLTFGSEDYDTDSFHSTVTNTSRITIPAGMGGYYLIYGMNSWDSNSTTGRRIIYIFKNNAEIIGAEVGVTAASPATYPAVQITTVLNLSAGDYVELEVYQSSGGSLNATAFNQFGVSKL
jgi:hypothetical protein